MGREQQRIGLLQLTQRQGPHAAHRDPPGVITLAIRVTSDQVRVWREAAELGGRSLGVKDDQATKQRRARD